MHPYERALAAQSLISQSLTPREREMVVAFAAGYTQAELARAWGTSAAAVSQMARRIHRKADQFWN